MTTPLSRIVSIGLRALFPVADRQWNQMFIHFTGIPMPQCPILMTTDHIIEHVDATVGRWMRKEGVEAQDSLVSSSDFAKLYPSVPQKDLLEKVSEMIRFLFTVYAAMMKKDSKQQNGAMGEPFLIVNKYPVCLEKEHSQARWKSNI